ncbi:hypothetical protein I4U23_010621 [Adineta vaga]|nr:hypothetical protein I4U23_010621 [Adineta vaga]
MDTRGVMNELDLEWQQAYNELNQQDKALTDALMREINFTTRSLMDEIIENVSSQIVHQNTNPMKVIMSHYDDDAIHFTSPLIVQFNNDPTGTISNKKDLQDYFSRALEKFPALHFELLSTSLSVNSLIIHYKSVNNMIAMEYFEFNDQNQVINVKAHYSN